jgi:Holliday junction DNA helicase RuvA
MIGMVRGRVRAIDPPTILVDVGGIGWELEVPSSLSEELADGEAVELSVRTVVRQESLTLYGFRDRMERELFDLLLKVQGVGPVVALGVIGALGVDGCYQAVANEDVAALVAAPGVGEKTARRILLDAKNKKKKNK